MGDDERDVHEQEDAARLRPVTIAAAEAPGDRTSPSRAIVFADRYKVVRRLGAGGSGAVFLATDERLGREVAVKRTAPR